MSQYQSTNSLQNSVISWTFPKKKRFIDFTQTNGKLYNIPTYKTNRATTQGYGNKYDFVSSHGKDSPSPFDYNLKSIFDINKEEHKGVIFAMKLKNLVKNIYHIR